MQAQAGYDNSSVISDFVNYVNEKIAMLGITNPDCVCNFDKTNVYFAPEFTHILQRKEPKQWQLWHQQAPINALLCLDVVSVERNYLHMLCGKEQTLAKLLLNVANRLRMDWPRASPTRCSARLGWTKRVFWTG